jgi:uncharacterized protein (TIGR03067 family)
MKTRMLVAVAVALLLAADETKNDAAKKDLEAIQGSWVGVSGEEDGKAVPEGAAKAMELIIKGDKYTFKVNGEEMEQGTLHLDPAQKPKALDLKITKGDDKGKSQKGLYQIEDGKLKICVSAPEKDRPKELSGKAGNKANLYVFQRSKNVG